MCFRGQLRPVYTREILASNGVMQQNRLVYLHLPALHTMAVQVYTRLQPDKGPLPQLLELEHALFLGNHLPINLLIRPREAVRYLITTMITRFSLVKRTN